MPGWALEPLRSVVLRRLPSSTQLCCAKPQRIDPHPLPSPVTLPTRLGPGNVHVLERGTVVGLLEQRVRADLRGGRPQQPGGLGKRGADTQAALGNQACRRCRRTVHPSSPLHPSMLTWSVALRRRMSERESEGISTLMRRMLPHGSVRTAVAAAAGRQKVAQKVLSQGTGLARKLRAEQGEDASKDIAPAREQAQLAHQRR